MYQFKIFENQNYNGRDRFVLCVKFRTLYVYFSIPTSYKGEIND